MPLNYNNIKKKKGLIINHIFFHAASYKPSSKGECSEPAAAIAIFLPIEASIPAGNLNEGGHHLKSPKIQNKTLTSCLRFGAAPAKHVGDIWGVKELIGVTHTKPGAEVGQDDVCTSRDDGKQEDASLQHR